MGCNSSMPDSDAHSHHIPRTIALTPHGSDVDFRPSMHRQSSEATAIAGNGHNHGNGRMFIYNKNRIKNLKEQQKIYQDDYEKYDYEDHSGHTTRTSCSEHTFSANDRKSLAAALDEMEQLEIEQAAKQLGERSCHSRRSVSIHSRSHSRSASKPKSHRLSAPAPQNCSEELIVIVRSDKLAFRGTGIRRHSRRKRARQNGNDTSMITVVRQPTPEAMAMVAAAALSEETVNSTRMRPVGSRTHQVRSSNAQSGHSRSNHSHINSKHSRSSHHSHRTMSRTAASNASAIAPFAQIKNNRVACAQ